ncbi:BTB/POZ domain-containing protein 8-like isoform X2 [Narcine bancroftii]|uniref:BTB/POZ domain-containing protein 8-like isoform X2 n=1 Tax=Narcine bancroftii TaxID=1343680 RepID=UPI0038317686
MALTWTSPPLSAPKNQAMKSEELGESPPVDVHVSDEAMNDQCGEPAKGLANKQVNNRIAKDKLSAKSAAGAQAKGKVGSASGQLPISGRPATSQTGKVANAATRRNNDQEQKAASTRSASSTCMSSHEKIMEKKMATRTKAAKGSVAAGCSSSGNGRQATRVEKAALTKTPLTVKSAPKDRNPGQHCFTSTASKKPLVGAGKPAAERPVKPLPGAGSRPINTMATSNRPSASAVRKQPISRPSNEHLTSARTNKPGIASVGARPPKLVPASSRKDMTFDSSQQKKNPSLGVSKTTTVARPTKPKLKSSEGTPTEKCLVTRMKAKTPGQPGRGAQPDPSKSLEGSVLYSIKKSKANEKRSLLNKTMTSRKTPSENNVERLKSLQNSLDVGAAATKPGVGDAGTATRALPRACAAGGGLPVAPSIENMAWDPQRCQTTESRPSSCLDLPDKVVSADGKTVSGEPQGSECLGTLEAVENIEHLGSVELSGRLSEGEVNSDQNDSVKIESGGGIVGSEDDVAKMVNLNDVEMQQIGKDENVTGAGGEMNFKDGDTEVHVLLDQPIPQVDSTVAHSEGTLSNVDPSALNTPLGSLPQCVPVIEDDVIHTPILEDPADHKAPMMGISSVESSPEFNRNTGHVKLSMCEYSEEAESPLPQELHPEGLSTRDQDVVIQPCNLAVESCKVSMHLESPAENENCSKLGIPPEDLQEGKGVSRSSTLSGPDLAGKSSSIATTPEELKDNNSSSGVESKSEKIDSAENFIPQRGELCRLDLVEQDLGIHLERGDYEPETLPADLLEGSSTEPLVSSEDEDPCEADLESVGGKTSQRGLEGIDNPVFEDKAANELKTEALALSFSSPQFKPSTLRALDEIEELGASEAATAASPEFGQLDPTASSALPNRLLHDSELQAGFSDDLPTVTDSQAWRPEVSPSTETGCPSENKCSTGSPPKGTSSRPSAQNQGEGGSDELSDDPLSGNVEMPGADHPTDCFGEDLAKLQELNNAVNNAEGGCLQPQTCPLYEKNDNLLTGIMNVGEKTLQTHCMPWITPMLPPVLSTIYEVETAQCEETRLEDDCENEEFQKLDLPGLELVEAPNDRVLSLQIEPVEVVQQLINHTLLLSGDGIKLQSKVMVDQAELSKWTDLISPLDDTTASITSVTSFSPEDLSSSQGEWTVVELETHH